MPETLFLQLKSNRRITLPPDDFKEGDLVMIKKVTKVEMDSFMVNLQRRDHTKKKNY